MNIERATRNEGVTRWIGLQMYMLDGSLEELTKRSCREDAVNAYLDLNPADDMMMTTV